jgi:hypothetical protein
MGIAASAVERTFRARREERAMGIKYPLRTFLGMSRRKLRPIETDNLHAIDEAGLMIR